MTDYAVLWIIFFVVVILSLAVAGYIIAKLQFTNNELVKENESLLKELDEAAEELRSADFAKERKNAEKN